MTNNRLTGTIDGSKHTNQLLRVLQPITWQFNWPVRSITRDINTRSTEGTISQWLWRWLPLRLSKRYSLSPKVLFRTTLTRTITLDKLLILLGSNHLLCTSIVTFLTKKTLRPVQTWCPSPGTKMDVVQTRQCPWTKNVHKQLGKRIDYWETGANFGVGSSTACRKVNTVGTDENLFRLVPVLGLQMLGCKRPRARARCPSTTSGPEPEPVPGHGVQICARAPTKGYAQTGARARAPSLNGALVCGTSSLFFLRTKCSTKIVLLYCPHLSAFSFKYETLIFLHFHVRS